MKKSFISILTIFIFGLCNAQYYAIVEGDTVYSVADSALIIVENRRAPVAWYYLKDGNKWLPLDINSDTLKIKIDNPGKYRGQKIISNYDTIYSEIVSVGLKEIITKSNNFYVDSTGGVFRLLNDIQVIVPENTIEDNQQFEIIKLNEEELNAYPVVELNERNFKTGFSISSGKLNLGSSIRMKIPATEAITNRDKALLYEFDGTLQSWKLVNTPVEFNSGDTTFNLILPLYSYKADQQGEFLTKSVSNDIRNFAFKVYLDIFHSVDPCREKRITTRSNADEYNTFDSGNDCVIVLLEEAFHYPDCVPDAYGTFVASAISSTCETIEKVNPPQERYYIKNGSSQKLSISCYVGSENFPLNMQKVYLYPSSNIELSHTYLETQHAGTTPEFDVKALDNSGSGNIHVKIKYEYFLTEILVEDDGDVERSQSDLIEKTVEFDIDVFTYDVCTPSEALTCRKGDIICESVKQNLIDLILFMPYEKKIKVGEGFQTKSRAYNSEGDQLPVPGYISYSPCISGVASISETGYVTGIKKGTCKISAKVCDFTDETTVFVVGDECENAQVSVKSYPRMLRRGTTKPIIFEYSNDEYGQAIIPQVTILSVDPQIAYADDSFNVTGNKIGKTALEVIFCDKTFLLPVNVCDHEYWNFDFEWRYICDAQICALNYVHVWGTMDIDWCKGEIKMVSADGVGMSEIEESECTIVQLKDVFGAPELYGNSYSDRKVSFSLNPNIVHLLDFCPKPSWNCVPADTSYVDMSCDDHHLIFNRSFTFNEILPNTGSVFINKHEKINGIDVYINLVLNPSAENSKGFLNSQVLDSQK